jgi:Dolichyl-phosphate-mannose-protein mannosyltransferase
MTTPPRKTYLDIQPLPLIILFAVLQLFTALFTEGFSLSFDEAMWQYIGRNWIRHNLVPFSGGVDNKSPFIYAVFGLSDSLFGVNYWFPRILGTICQSVGIYYVFKIAQKLAGHREGILAITLYGLSLLWRSTGGKYVSYTETYAITCIIAAFYYYLDAEKKSDFIVSGFLAGIAIGFRVSAFFPMIALAVLTGRNFKKMGFFLLGLILAAAVLSTLSWLSGIHISEIITYCLIDNFGTGTTTDHAPRWKFDNFMNKFFYSEMLLFYFPFAAFLLIRKKINVLTTWLVFEFIGIAIPGSFSSQHLKAVLPPLCIASGIAIYYLIQTCKWHVNAAMLLIWILFFPKSAEPWTNLKRFLAGQSPIRAAMTSAAIYEAGKTDCDLPVTKPDEYSEKNLGLWVKSVTGEKDKVLVAGYGARVQAYSERQSPTIYFNVTQTDKAKEKFIDDILHEKKPALVLVPAFAEYNSLVREDIRSFLNDLVTDEYAFVGCLYGYKVYRKRS